MAEYRIVRDNYLGFEVQARRWWHWPFWSGFGVHWKIANTHSTIEEAEAFANAASRPVVKYLGHLPPKAD